MTAPRRTLLTGEIATTVVLLIAAGLLLKCFWHLRATNVGCVTDNVLTMGFSLSAKQYDTPEKANAFKEQLAPWGMMLSRFASIHRSRLATRCQAHSTQPPTPATSARCRYHC
jgi:hypothetical protein